MSAPHLPNSAPGGERPAMTNPALSANLLADYEALQNDVRQARELAGDFQRQLAGKSNEVADLKQVFDKTTRDLAHLETGIRELREERHRLANEAMRALMLEHKLRAELERASEREARIASLLVEVATLEERLAARPAVKASVLDQPAVRTALAEVSASVHRLLTLAGSGTPAVVPPRPPPLPETTEDSFIEIAFER